MVFRYSMIAAMLLVLLGGCAKNGSGDAKQKMEGIKDDVKTSADHVWSAQVKALDKAKSVGRTLMDAADEQRKAIERKSR
jgi:outer membrane lipoprotein-sorting protein